MKSPKFYFYPRLQVGDKFLNTTNGVFYTIIGRYTDNITDVRYLTSYEGTLELAMSVEELTTALCEKKWFKLPVFVEVEEPKNRLQTVD